LAEGLSRAIGLVPDSAGTHPAQNIAPNAVKVLQDRGISAEGMRPKNVNDFSADDYDMVISMGCGVHCPLMPIEQDWELEDPVGQALHVYESTADEIVRRLQLLES